MQNTGPLAVESLLSYLNACGGCDTYQLWTESGQPDLQAARDLAEKFRSMLGDQLGVVASVEQSFNRVTLCVNLETARV
jgi:hypothetical protein